MDIIREIDDGRDTDETTCWECCEKTDLKEYDDLSGNGEKYALCHDCAEEMFDSWDAEKGKPK